MDLLLKDFGWETVARLAIIRDLRNSFAEEFRQDGAFSRRMGERFRRERVALEALLGDADSGGPLDRGLLALRRRSEKLRPVTAALWDAERAGRLARPLPEIARSYLHLHANRLLRSAHRQQEWLLYDFLARIYESQLARAQSARSREGKREKE
jgi:thiopeptide-type bacteriocin biosynthesis protein